MASLNKTTVSARRSFWLCLVFVVACSGCSDSDSSASPSLVGFGTDTVAGNGGQVIRVTSLAESGAGSLREALETAGPRIVVFEVGGVIDLQQRGLSISEPFITIAGQTAPSPGITIIKGGLTIFTHDVLMQHISIRPGDAGQPKGSGWEPDGISTSGGDAFNIVIDHCSLTWAVDENLSASGPATEGPDATSHRITFSHCIIAEGLDDSSHAKGPHSKGSLIHDFVRDVSIIGCLYAHNDQRNPYFKAFTTGVIVNNVIYNPGSWAIQLFYVQSEWVGTGLTPENGRFSIVGNVLYHGVDTLNGLHMLGPFGDVYMHDNVAWDQNGVAAEIAYAIVVELDEPPLWPEGLVSRLSSDTTEWVLQNVGARPGDRDPIDARIVATVRDRTGGIIDSQDDVGGYPSYSPTTRRLRVPEDPKVVDVWLASFSKAVLPN
ncbi:MAG: right-handed parallel beta-helix repeat-containing protein [Candidatus Hydrogenedentota bacterium]